MNNYPLHNCRRTNIGSLLAIATTLALSTTTHAEEITAAYMPAPQLGPPISWSDIVQLPELHPGVEQRDVRTSATFPKTGDFGITSLSKRHLSKAFYNIVYNASEGIPDGWTGDTASCTPGDTTDDFKDAILIRINYYRAMAGVPDDIILNSTYNAKDQEAALLTSRNNDASHHPATDHPTWPCLTSNADEAASNSNLSLGNHGYNAIMSQMRDAGTNDKVGHRRWILYPLTNTMGTGDIPVNGDYNSANALWINDPAPDGTRTVRNNDGSVTWPPPGYVPYSIVYPRWSFSYPGADFSSATVAMFNVSNGNSSVATLPEIVDPNFAGESTIVWVPDGLDAESYSTTWPNPGENDVTYLVAIDNVDIKDGKGATTDFSYMVTIFDPAVEGDGEIFPTISEDASTAASGDYTHTTVNFDVYDYEMRELTFMESQDSEGAELGTTNDIIDSTDISYTLIDSGRKNSGTYSFHLARPTTTPQSFTIDRDFLITSTSTFRFYWTRGWASDTQYSKAYMSIDGGSSWIELFSNNSLVEAWAPTTFTQEIIPLGNYSGKTARFKFAYENTGGLYYNQTDSGVGFHVDDILVSNAQEIASATDAISIGTSGKFNYTPSGSGDYAIQVRAVPWDGFSGLDWGPIFSVLECPTPNITRSYSAANGTVICTGVTGTNSTIGTGADVTFKSNSSMTINPGFWAKAGSFFRALVN